ncbi:MAG TPA: bifunctional phosphoglucose/phosphomannose isomerase [Acidimicrobiia bacterium]|nr:bifunctional phosphoglucose/phosphomannose isomerase [Acidimicrobiia bacterium]
MAVDSLNIGDTLYAVPEELAAAHERAGRIDRVRLPAAADFDHVVVCGMGGSGVVGDILRAVGTASVPVPLIVLKHYRTPAFVGPRTLAFAVSYSGDTEETLEMARGAFSAGAHVVTVSRGGALAQFASERNLLHVGCPPDLSMPRLALGPLLAPLVVILFRMGLLPEGHATLLKAQEQLKRRRDQCNPNVEAPRNPARELARRIDRTIPIIYGGGGFGAAAAMRWKSSINENAKAPAFWNAYPELDHNEVSGWGQHGDVTRQVFTLVELHQGLEHPQLERQMAATRELIDEALHQIIVVEAEGEGRLAQLLDIIYLGDWTSYYLALDNDVDPGPIDAITQLKAMVASS